MPILRIGRSAVAGVDDAEGDSGRGVAVAGAADEGVGAAAGEAGLAGVGEGGVAAAGDGEALGDKVGSPVGDGKDELGLGTAEAPGELATVLVLVVGAAGGLGAGAEVLLVAAAGGNKRVQVSAPTIPSDCKPADC
jgi:hypothetical protein